MTTEAKEGYLRRNDSYALVAHKRIERLRQSLPPLPSKWVRVRIAYCGLCGSDVRNFSDQRMDELPLSLGHEWVGVIEAVGSDVGSLHVGDVVTTDLNYRCGCCSQCLQHRSHLCEQRQVGRFTNRGFAARTDIHASYLYRCNASPVPELALAEPLSCVIHALSKCHLSRDSRILVLGAGGLGVCLSFLLWTRPMSVPHFDVTDLNVERLRRLGRAIYPRGRPVRNPTDLYDVVLDMSGTASGLLSACERVLPGGQLCTMTHLPRGESPNAMYERVLRKDVTLYFSYLNGEPSNIFDSIRLLEESWTSDWAVLLNVSPIDTLESILHAHPSLPSNKSVFDLTEGGQ